MPDVNVPMDPRPNYEEMSKEQLIAELDKCREHLTHLKPAPSTPKISLKGQAIRLDEKERGVWIGDTLIRCRGSVEKIVLRVMFRHEPKDRVSWDEIYEEEEPLARNTGRKPKNIRAYKRRITDAADRINAKVHGQINTDDDLLHRESNDIFRYLLRMY